MEGYGAAHAVHTAKSHPRFLMIKGICDWANPDKNDDWQEYAADVAAGYVVNFLKSKPIDIKSDEPIKQTEPFPEILFYSPDRILQKNGFKKMVVLNEVVMYNKKQIKPK